jgi:G:T-mismatch repair DNA endonuclease (very short patch repair protein)
VAWTTTKEAAYQLFKQHLAFYGSQLKKKNIEREENSLDELKEQHGVKLVVFGCPTKEKSHAT